MSTIKVMPVSEDSDDREEDIPVVEESSASIYHEQVEPGSDQETRNILEAFLSVNYRPTETARVYIRSLDSYITIRELTERELADVMQMEGGSAGKFKKPDRERGLTEVAAQIVATALVDPDLNDSTTYKKLSEALGVTTHLQIIRKVFKPLEITALAEHVLDLSGGADDAVQISKN